MNKKLINEISQIKSLMNIKESFEYEDISSLSKYNSSKMNSDENFIIHHTAGRGRAEDVVNVLNNKTDKKGKKYSLGVQWVIDRKGKIYQTLPKGHKGAHILNSDKFPTAPKGINNSNSQGVEIVAKDDSDVLPVQCIAALKLIKSLGYSQGNIYGHGEVNPSHRPKSEGQTCKSFVLSHWNDNIEGLDKKMDKSDFSKNSASEVYPVVNDTFSNVNFKDRAVGNSTPSQDRINPALLADVQTAAKNAGVEVSITTAVSGHKKDTRHETGNAVDIAMINGKGWTSETMAKKNGIYDKIESFVSALEDIGYKKNSSESGNPKVVLTFGFPNHHHHVHVSNVTSSTLSQKKSPFDNDTEKEVTPPSKENTKKIENLDKFGLNKLLNLNSWKASSHIEDLKKLMGK